MKIDQLLEKYWEGETSIEEEKVLSQYFNSDKIEDKHQSIAPLFQFYKQQSQIECELEDTDLASKLNDEIQVNTQENKVKPLRLTQHLRRIAAVGVIVFVSIWGMNNYYDQNLSVSEDFLVENPEEAYEITREALSLIGRKMNKANKSVKNNISPLSVTSIIKK